MKTIIRRSSNNSLNNTIYTSPMNIINNTSSVLCVYYSYYHGRRIFSYYGTVVREIVFNGHGTIVGVITSLPTYTHTYT